MKYGYGTEGRSPRQHLRDLVLSRPVSEATPEADTWTWTSAQNEAWSYSGTWPTFDAPTCPNFLANRAIIMAQFLPIWTDDPETVYGPIPNEGAWKGTAHLSDLTNLRLYHRNGAGDNLYVMPYADEANITGNTLIIRCHMSQSAFDQAYRYETRGYDANTTTEIRVSDNITAMLSVAVQFEIENDSNNDGIYTTSSATYDGLNTTFTVSPALSSTDSDGNIKITLNQLHRSALLATLTETSEAAWVADLSRFKRFWKYTVTDQWDANLQADDQQITGGDGTSYAITAVDQGAKIFTIAGDYTANFTAGITITVSGSTGNDGNYTVVSSALYLGDTDITVTEAIPDPSADGSLVHAAAVWGYYNTRNVPTGASWAEVKLAHMDYVCLDMKGMTQFNEEGDLVGYLDYLTKYNDDVVEIPTTENCYAYDYNTNMLYRIMRNSRVGAAVSYIFGAPFKVPYDKIPVGNLGSWHDVTSDSIVLYYKSTAGVLYTATLATTAFDDAFGLYQYESSGGSEILAVLTGESPGPYQYRLGIAGIANPSNLDVNDLPTDGFYHAGDYGSFA